MRPASPQPHHTRDVLPSITPSRAADPVQEIRSDRSEIEPTPAGDRIQTDDRRFARGGDLRTYLERVAHTRGKDESKIGDTRLRLTFRALMPDFLKIVEEKEQRAIAAAEKHADLDFEPVFDIDKLMQLYDKSKLLLLAASDIDAFGIPARFKEPVAALCLQAYGNFRVELGLPRQRAFFEAVSQARKAPHTQTDIESEERAPVPQFNEEALNDTLDKLHTASIASADRGAAGAVDKLIATSRAATAVELQILRSRDSNNVVYFGTTTYHLRMVEQQLLNDLQLLSAPAKIDDWLPKTAANCKPVKKHGRKKTAKKKTLVPPPPSDSKPDVKPYSVCYSERYSADQRKVIESLRDKLASAKNRGEALEYSAQLDVALALEGEEFVGANHLLVDDAGKIRTEIDLETRAAIFEFTTEKGWYWDTGKHGGVRVRSKRKLDQVSRLVTDARVNPFKKSVIFYAPFFDNNDDLATLAELGVILPQTPAQLREAVLQLK